MHLMCGGIFSHQFTANLLLNQPLKEFWKSLKIWQRYCHEFGGVLFWNTVYIPAYFQYLVLTILIAICIFYTVVNITRIFVVLVTYISNIYSHSQRSLNTTKIDKIEQRWGPKPKSCGGLQKYLVKLMHRELITITLFFTHFTETFLQRCIVSSTGTFYSAW